MDGYMTKLRNLAPLLLLAFAPAAALAEDYRFEVKGSYKDGDSGYHNVDSDSLALSGTWYFAPVTTDGVPRSEAAFLGHASSLSALVAQLDVLGTTLDAEAVSVDYYLPGTMFYFGAGASREEFITALSSTFVETDYDTTWFGTLGIAPLAGLLITTSFTDEDYDPNVTARYVGKLPNDHFYAGSVSMVDPDRADPSFALDFDYYLDNSTSLGVGYTDAFFDRWEIRGEKFFSKSWAVGVSASTSDGDDGFGINVTWRH